MQDPLAYAHTPLKPAATATLNRMAAAEFKQFSLLQHIHYLLYTSRSYGHRINYYNLQLRYLLIITELKDYKARDYTSVELSAYFGSHICMAIFGSDIVICVDIDLKANRFRTVINFRYSRQLPLL